MDIIIIGAFIVIIGGFVSAIGTRMQNKASSTKSDKQLKKIEELNEQNTKLIGSLTNLSGQNSELATQLGSLSEQNSKLMLELSNARSDVDRARTEAIDNTFGSKGAIFIPGSSGHGKLFNELLLPVYDAKIVVTQYDQLIKCDRYKDQDGSVRVSTQCYNNATKRYTVPIIYGHTVMDLTDFIIDMTKPLKVIVKFITKKGTYYQQFIHSPELGSAYRILEEEDEGKYWQQYLKVPFLNGAVPREKSFRTITVRNAREKDIDWEKEFPLPVSFLLGN